ncbi:LysM peptidoglycan-binding domain-containing protein [Marinobacter mobilis]|uniref:Membrane-bound lytic murein transglycosylase D n=1 Tax=Marinobacter mobilis TaxID=488533 RepID=A0A1H2V5E6_9GAMM|nr:LysM peptidoglycan-binding domain-containing protein [Marinobacter mobilis]SDW63528.1 membrane-bound lytic murein transglycosylase D [Marinobacter mobilis]
MMSRRFAALLVSSTLTAGCSSLQTPGSSWWSATGDQEESLLSSASLQVATGDQELVRSVESGDENKVSASDLDDSIAPELQATAEKARESLEAMPPQADADIGNSDLWQRLRDGFSLDLTVSNERIEQQLNWYVNHPSYIRRVSERASRYMYHVLNEAEKRGLPTELALLPVVESAFDPFAYSHGRAAGLWQFIPSTGKYFGLTQSWWHDDRRDILAATDAAYTYLERLANRFDGDYTLALAAYNSGGGTVSSAIRRNQRSNKATNFWALDLPRETRHYVPKLIALAKIYQDPAAYGIELPALEDQPYFEVVETGFQLDLAQAATLAGVSTDEIYLLNPSYNRWATTPDGPHRLLVPAENAEQFREGINALPAEQRVSWQNYQVVSGDSLIRIARNFGTTPAVIREVNNMNGDMIRAGQHLLIPTASRGSSAYSLSQNQRLAATQARGSRSGNGQRIEYTVRSGDTFWDIARENGVSVRQVASWNGMAPGDPLMPGQTLVIWSQTANPTTLASARNNAMVRRVGYQVRRGDSLSTIASRFSVNVSDIASWNNLNTSRYLQPGQSLVLYVDIRNAN